MLDFLRSSLQSTISFLEQANFKGAVNNLADLLDYVGEKDVAKNLRTEVSDANARDKATAASNLLNDLLDRVLGPAPMYSLGDEIKGITMKMEYYVACCQPVKPISAVDSSQMDPALTNALLTVALKALIAVWERRHPKKLELKPIEKV